MKHTTKYYTGFLDSSEIYDPLMGKWYPTANLATTRSAHTTTLLKSGKVFVTGGEQLGNYV